jgi:hypothetical protein
MSALLLPCPGDLYNPGRFHVAPATARRSMDPAPRPAATGVRHIREILPDVLTRALSTAEAVQDVA